jgi:type I restriction enzyme S subunit
MSAIQRLMTDHIDIWTAAEAEKKSGRGRTSGNAANVYGIQKLRELILELAVRGKLVLQDSSDEPARELLKRIDVERKWKVSSGQVIKDKQLPKILPSEMVHQLPSTWEWVRFGEVAQHNSGKTLDSGRNEGTSHDYITTSNLYWGRFELSTIRQMLIKDDEFVKCSAKKGDLLICEGGEAGRAAVWFEENEICFQNHIHRARFYCDVNPYYAYRFFEKLNVTGEINQHRKGVGISNMSGKALASIVFPMPPIEEQHRIVVKVDELMALCDQLESKHGHASDALQKLVGNLLGTLTQSQSARDFNANWKRIAANFGTLFTTESSIYALEQTLLQLAVMGKLVEQDENDEPADELLKRIRTEKFRLIAEKKVKKDASLPPVVEEDISFELPHGWSWGKMGDICVQITDGTHQTPKYVPTGRPFLSAKNIKPFKFMPTDHRFVSQEDFDKLRKNRVPEKGDILLTRVGAMIGEAAVIDTDVEFAFYVSLGLLKPSKENISSEFVALWLNSPLGTGTSIRNTLGRGVSAGNLNLSLIRNFVLGLPPLNEQLRIVAKIGELMMLCDQLRSRIRAANQHMKQLADVCVEHAVLDLI